MSGYLRQETPGWGVMNADGLWLDGAWHVEEETAREVYRTDPEAAVLCSDVDTDFDQETQVVVEVRQACPGCGAPCETVFDGGSVVAVDHECADDLVSDKEESP